MRATLLTLVEPLEDTVAEWFLGGKQGEAAPGVPGLQLPHLPVEPAADKAEMTTISRDWPSSQRTWVQEPGPGVLRLFLKGFVLQLVFCWI